MNIFENIFNKAKSGVDYLATGKAGSDLYDWANPETQDPIQRFLDDPAMDMSKKQALMDNLKSGVPTDVMKSYVTEKYYKQPEFKQTVPTVSPTFPITGEEGLGTTMAKQIGNFPSSLYNFGATGVNIASTAYQEGIPETAGMLGRGIIKSAGEGAQNVATSYQDKGLVGATNTVLEGAIKTLAEDPASWIGAPLVKPAVVGTGKAIVRGAEKVAPKVVQGIKTGAKATGEGVGKVTKSIVSQQSGLGTPAIESILSKPELQGKIRSGELSGAKTLEEARSSIDALREGYRETGKMYDTVRKSNIPVAKNEAKQVLLSQLESEGLATGGKLNLVDLPVKDRGAITQALKYIDEYGDTMTPQNALSIRQKLDDLINYKSDVGSNGQRIVQGLRSKYDEFLGNKLPGLKEIDAKYAPERQFWESIRKDIYKADGTLKDNALSVVSNITNKGNEARLARMEQILPGIGEKVKALKAFDDIQNASGIKVGTYGRAATTGAIALASVPLAIASWVATHPVVVARVLESIGIASQKIKSILAKGKNITKEDATIIQKAVAKTPKSKVEGIINNLSYDPKTSKLTSKTLVKKPIVKPNSTTNAKQQVIKPTSSNTIPEGYFKNAFGEIQKNPSNKKGGFIRNPFAKPKPKLAPEGKAMSIPKTSLIEEARKYKSADEFIKAQTKKEYRSAHQLNNADSITADKIDINKLKEAIRTRNGYLNNYVLADLKKLEKLQNNPEGKVTIYRASPKNELNEGDWVTTDKSYAQYIKKQNGGQVNSFDVYVKDLRFPNDLENLPSLQMATTFNYGPNIDRLTKIYEQSKKLSK